MTLKARLVARGISPQKLVARLGRAGIPIFNAETRDGSVRFTCLKKDAEKALEIAQNMGYETEPPRLIGAAALLFTARGRVALLISLIAAAVMLTAAMTLIWQVKIVDAAEYTGEIRLALEEMGIRPMLKREQINLNDLREKLEWRLPRVKWVQVYYQGVSLVVKAVLGQSPGDAVTIAGSGDVVAAEDAIITQILTYAGTPLVSPGQIVRKGQILIEGYERGKGEERLPVKARGSVSARVFRFSQAEVPLTELESTPTGRETRAVVIKTPFFSWASAEAPNYLTYDASVVIVPLCGAFFPAEAQYISYAEVSVEEIERPEEEVKQEAALIAMRKLTQTLVFRDDVIDKWVDYSMINRGRILATATAELIIEIGRYQSHDE